MTSETIIKATSKSSNPSLRNAFSIMELVITVSILGLLAAVTIPRWTNAIESSQLNSCAQTLRADLLRLVTHAVRTSTPITVQIESGSPAILITPPVPSILGDSNGKLDYGTQFNSLRLTESDFDGQNAFTITMYGELVSSTTNSLLSTATLTLQNSADSVVVELLPSNVMASPQPQRASAGSNASDSANEAASVDVNAGEAASVNVGI